MKYGVGDIVVLETEDVFKGDVRVPGIITGLYPKYQAYEVRVVFPMGGRDPRVHASWTVSEPEISMWLGKARQA